MFYKQFPFYSILESDASGGNPAIVTDDNYEQYLLLYVDNELSDEERRLTEEFIKCHPEAQELFESLKETKLQPDQLLPASMKQQLYQPDAQLLSYFDHELSSAEAQELKTTIQQAPVLQHLLMQLEKTRLQPDPEIVFPNKQVLYRSTSRTPVLLFSPALLKWAAVFLIMLGTAVWVFTLKNNNQNHPVAEQTPTEKTPPPQAAEQNMHNTVVVRTPPKSVRDERADNHSGQLKKNAVPTAQTPTTLPAKEPEIALTVPAPQQTNVQPETGAEQEILSRNKTNTSTVSFKNNQSDEAVTASIVDGPNENPLPETRRNKMKNMFIKARRIFERSTGFHSEEPEFRVAVFSISTQKN